MTDWIQQNAERYAEDIRIYLEGEPIAGVNPTIASNAHRTGYLKGAYDVHDRYVKTVIMLYDKLKVWQIYGCVATIVIVILIMFI